MENKTILIIAGGTGGHVMPALAAASELIKQGIKVHWVGTQTGIEAKIVEAQGIPIEYIRIRGLRKRGLLGWIKAPFEIFTALMQSIGIIRRIKPRVILSMGGYVSGPGSIAAWLCGCPVIIHEQNAAPGLTNRLLAPVAKLILTGFPNVFLKQAQKTHYTGNPVRTSISLISKNKAINNINITDNINTQTRPLRLLVVGGSLGASILNQTLPQALGALELNVKPEVWHQTGQKQQKETVEAYEKQGITAKVEPFIDDMASAYAWADGVICRAGALTVAELTIVGLPSILIPFPFAVDDHQTQNAKYLTQAGAALLLPQSQLSTQVLTKMLNDFLKLNYLKSTGDKALSLAKPHATQEVVRHLLNTLN